MGMLTKQAQACGGYSAPELQKLLEERCSSSLQQRKENAQELIASTQAVLDKQGAAWKAACAAIGQLLTQLSEAHDRHNLTCRCQMAPDWPPKTLFMCFDQGLGYL